LRRGEGIRWCVPLRAPPIDSPRLDSPRHTFVKMRSHKTMCCKASCNQLTPSVNTSCHQFDQDGALAAFTIHHHTCTCTTSSTSRDQHTRKHAHTPNAPTHTHAHTHTHTHTCTTSSTRGGGAIQHKTRTHALAAAQGGWWYTRQVLYKTRRTSRLCLGLCGAVEESSEGSLYARRIFPGVFALPH